MFREEKYCGLRGIWRRGFVDLDEPKKEGSEFDRETEQDCLGEHEM